jgi:predicted GNAT family acetyltransferase
MNGKGDAVDVVDNEAEHRYEARVDGQLAVLTYRRSGDRITFIHTGVPAALEGRGIAGTLARVALEDARAAGLAVIPRCPYIAAYIRRHPEYADLVPPAERAHYLERKRGDA